MNRKKICSALLLILFLFWLFGAAYPSTVTVPPENNIVPKDQLLIAVLDTGYSGSDSRIAVDSYNALDDSADITDGNGHGTDITSIILNNTLEQATILPIKIADYVGVSNEDAACKGIQYAMEMDADIIHIALNMSNLSSDSKLYCLLNEAIASGIDVVTSAGNNGKSTETFFPANIEDAVVVSAANQNGEFWKYSNFGDTIDFASNGYYNGKTGTSYATARVAAMLANEYLNGGNIETLKEKAVDAGIKGKDPLYGYGLLMCSSDISDKDDTDTYVGRSANDLGSKLLDIDWKNTDADKLNDYFIETHRAYVGMYLSRLSEQELLELKQKVPVLNTNVLVQDFKLEPLTSSYKESDSCEESFVANALSTYQSYEEELSISAEFLMLKNHGYFAISSHDRNDIYHFQVSGFSYRVANQDSEWFQMFNPAELTVTRTIVKQTTGFGAVYVSGLSTYVCGVSSFAEEYTHTYTGQVIAHNNLFAIDAESDDGALGYGLAVQISGYSNYKQGYHTTETDIIQIPYNFAHTYSQYSYASYPEPLQYIFSYYIPETNDVGYSTVPQRVEVQPKNFKTLMPVTMKIWYDGVYKDGLDYRNVNESLSLWDKLNTYLKSWKEKTVHGVNIYSDQTSLTNNGLTINFNIGCSMGIQWNNGETSTVATLSDIPEYNFPLVINTYRIKYHGNGATSGSMADTNMTYNVAKNLTATPFKRTGYIFQGWATSANGAAVYSDGQSVMNLTDQHDVTVNLYAVWKPISYTIRYHGNGSTSGSMGDTAMVYDTAKNLDVNKYAKTGYVFKGWATSSTGSVAYANSQAVINLTTTNGGVINLYAVWSPLTYIVRYNANGATSGSMPDSVMTYNVASNLSLNIYKRTGYLFQGWATSPTGGVVYSDGQSVINLTTTPGSIIHLYAVWKPISYTIRFHGNGSTSGSMGDMAMIYDVAKNLDANKYVKTGYIFQGWATSSTGGVVYTNGQSVKNLTTTNGGIIHLYAVWSPLTYTIRYHGNGSTSGSMPDSIMTYDKAANLSINIYKKTGYLFQGWSTSSTGSVVYSDGQSVINLTTTPGDIIHLYAVWKPITYTIRFHGNGSTSGSMADITATYDKNVTLTLNAYFKTGYTFRSWNTQSNGSGTSYSDGQTVKNLTATNGAIVYLYVQWTPNPYTIVFHANGGEGSMASIRATYDTPITLPRSTFTKSTVYGPSVFKGWHTNSSTFTPLYADGATVLNLTAAYNGVVTIYAIWDDCPWIIAEDLYYTLKEAQEGYITYDELMLHALAEDREDGSPIPPGINAQKGTSFVIVDYQASDFTQFQNSGSVTETYKVTDSFGSSYSKLITVHITDTDAYIPPPVGTTRFINETYYKKSFSQGGLDTDSVWLNNQLYKTALEKAFANSRNNKPEASFFFSYEDILEMKDYVNTNGHGTTQNPDALRLFYNLFLVPNKKT